MHSRSREAFSDLRRRSEKYDNYFAHYDIALQNLPANPTIVEIGIANGGSLELWRKLAGPHSRIIGVDLNPGIEELRSEGFEVLCADMGTDSGWQALKNLLGSFGSVDVLIDDGGHTNKEQMLALYFGIPLVKPGGTLIIEDVHASFMRSFGNPGIHSAWEMMRAISSDLHKRHPLSNRSTVYPGISDVISNLMVSDGIVSFKKKDNRYSNSLVVSGQDATLQDYDHKWDRLYSQRYFQLFQWVSSITRRLIPLHLAPIKWESWITARRLKKDFWIASE